MKSHLTLSTYEPDFDDPRVRKKLRAVIKWAQKLRLSKRPVPINHAKLREVFGNTARPGLARWARSNLLIQVGTYQVGKMPYQYRLNEDGFRKIARMLKDDPPSLEQAAMQEYGGIVSGNEDMVYLDAGGRRYHPIQNLPKAVRRATFFGWFDYDIETSAPTLMYQYALEHWRWLNHADSVAEPFATIKELTVGKAQVREHIASITGLTPDNAKRILATMFFQGILSPHGKATLFRLLGEDYNRHATLLNDPWVRRFIADVKSMWQYALWRDSRDRTMNMLKLATIEGPQQKNAARTLAISIGPYANLFRLKRSQLRQRLYMRIEREVMDAMLAPLGFPRRDLILMHDGFMSKSRVDRGALEKRVLELTGYSIRLSESRIGETLAREEFDWIDEAGVDKSEEVEDQSV